MCRPECEDLRGSEEGWRKGGVSMVWRQMGRQHGTIMVGGDRGVGRERVVCASGRVVCLESGDKTVGCPDLARRHHRRDARPDHASEYAVSLHHARGQSSSDRV